MQRSPTSRRLLAFVSLTCLAGSVGPAAALAQENDRSFQRAATYPVFKNLSKGVDRGAETVAEISTASADGNTLIYTDAAGKRVGFLDIKDPGAPKGLGSVDLATLGNKDDQPTSVGTVGAYVLVVVDTSASFTNPSGRVDVLRISDRKRVRSIPLPGQPDSIAVDDRGKVAAIAIENQRDEEFAPQGREKGDLPQPPAGSVVLLATGGEPARWRPRTIALVKPDGSALPALARLEARTDPEPEYVDINADGIVAVTLQENNGVVLIDSATGKLVNAFSAGSVTVRGVDTAEDRLLDPTGKVTAPREPDGVNWIDDRYLATANEGDWKGGTRGWSIFDSRTGKPVWDAGNRFDRLGLSLGVYNDERSEAKGVEPEGVVIGEYRKTKYAFVTSERGNFVAVYDLSTPTRPRYLQTLPTTPGPEGILAIGARNLLTISSEVDDAKAGVRASVAIYEHKSGRAKFPTIASAQRRLVPWGALGALAAVPGRTNELVAASDAAYAKGKIYRVDVARRPALIRSAITVTEKGEPVALDIEGIAARRGGGYWTAVEGETGAENQLVYIDRRGAVRRRVALPKAIASQVGRWGLEGVTIAEQGATPMRDTLYFVLQRPLFKDPEKATGEVDGKDVARIGRVSPATKRWDWFGYELESTETEGDWLGLSEITALPDGGLAVIERDKLAGPAAKIKRIYTVSPPNRMASRRLPVLPKRLLVDVLPRLRATKGWTQEKLEGLALTEDRNLYAVTDNDALKDASGETVFLRLGRL